MNTDYNKKIKNNIYKINIISHSSKEKNKKNINNSNALFLNSQTPNRKKSNLQMKMESAFCTKKYKNENGSSGAKILKELHKSKSLRSIKGKDSDTNLENNSNTVKQSKNEENANKNISREIKHNINYNININNSNTNEIFDLLKFTNNLYNQEKHLKKEIPTKKLDINNLSKFDKNFNNYLTKKKLFIQFGLNNKRRKSFRSSNEIPKDDNKTNFSNYLKFKSNQIIENNDESNEYEENINKINYIKEYYTSKSTKNAQLIFNKPKIKKNSKILKNKIIYEQSEKENEKENSKLKQTTKTKKESSKKLNKKISKIINVEKKEKEKEAKINTDKKEKKKKFHFLSCFCCLNKELNDSK